MRRLTIAPNLALATLWADWLCQVGIRTTVQRAFAGSIAGELPPDQAQPELWIDDDEELQRAGAAARRVPPSALASLGLSRLPGDHRRPVRAVLELW